MNAAEYPRSQYSWAKANNFRMLADLIQNEAEAVDFSEGVLTEAESEEFAVLLGQNDSCLALNLSDCGLTPSLIRPLCNFLASGSLIRYIYIYDNLLGDDGAVALSHALEENSALTFLSVSKNNIRNRGAAAFASLIQNNNSLQFLGLAKNQIGDDGAVALAKALEFNTGLLELVVSYNLFHQQGELAFADAISCNNTLKYLTLHQDKITEKGGRAIVKALKSNNTIAYLGLGIYTTKKKKRKTITRKILTRNDNQNRKSADRYRQRFQTTALDAKGQIMVPWGKSKLMVVGAGRIGKTALVRSLQGLKLNTNQPSTVGIDVSFAKTQHKTTTQNWIRVSATRAKESIALELAAREAISRERKNEVIAALRQSEKRKSVTGRRQSIIKSLKRGTRTSRYRSRSLALNSERSLRNSRNINEDILQEEKQQLKLIRMSVDRDLRHSLRRRRSSVRSVKSRVSSRISFSSNRLSFSRSRQGSADRTVSMPNFAVTADFNDLDDFADTENISFNTKADRKSIQNFVNGQNFAEAIHEEDEKAVSFTVYDYGGQSVFHPLHHLFLTNNGIYVLAFSLPDFVSSSEHQSVTKNIKFWLQSILLQAPDAVILLVGTFMDKLQIDASYSKINQQLKLVLDVSNKLQIVPNKAQGLVFFPISNKTRVGVPSLRKSIELIANKLESVTKKVPLRWVKCFEQLKEIAVSDVNNKKAVLRTRIARKVFAKLGVTSLDEIKDMLQFFNNHGFLIYLTHTEHLSEVIILDPQWILNAITQVIRDTSIHLHDEQDLELHGLTEDFRKFRTEGVASQDILEYFWGRENFPFILDLLQHVMLLSTWQFSKEKYFIFPSMVKQKRKLEVSNSIDGEVYKCSLNFHNYFPDGMLHRLICLSVEQSREKQVELIKVVDSNLQEPGLYENYADIKLGRGQSYQIYQINSRIVVETRDYEVASGLVDKMRQMISRINRDLFRGKIIFDVQVSQQIGEKLVFVSLEDARNQGISPWFTDEEAAGVTRSQILRTRLKSTTLDLNNFLDF